LQGFTINTNVIFTKTCGTRSFVDGLPINCFKFAIPDTKGLSNLTGVRAVGKEAVSTQQERSPTRSDI
jgi:hypothetical protein